MFSKLIHTPSNIGNANQVFLSCLYVMFTTTFLNHLVFCGFDFQLHIAKSFVGLFILPNCVLTEQFCKKQKYNIYHTIMHKKVQFLIDVFLCTYSIPMLCFVWFTICIHLQPKHFYQNDKHKNLFHSFDYKKYILCTF